MYVHTHIYTYCIVAAVEPFNTLYIRMYVCIYIYIYTYIQPIFHHAWILKKGQEQGNYTCFFGGLKWVEGLTLDSAILRGLGNTAVACSARKIEPMRTPHHCVSSGHRPRGGALRCACMRLLDSCALLSAMICLTYALLYYHTTILLYDKYRVRRGWKGTRLFIAEVFPCLSSDSTPI